jgi:hypothetical protein
MGRNVHELLVDECRNQEQNVMIHIEKKNEVVQEQYSNKIQPTILETKEQTEMVVESIQKSIQEYVGLFEKSGSRRYELIHTILFSYVDIGVAAFAPFALVILLFVSLQFLTNLRLRVVDY